MIFALVLCAACKSSPAPDQPRSAWGEVFTIAQADQSSAPALWADPSHLIAAWVGSDNAGVHHDVRGWADGKFSPVIVSPLPPIHPYGQALVSGSGGNLHCFWLDAAANGETQLFSALIGPQLTVERGPTPVSDSLTLRYAATAGSDGQAWVAWSGSPLIEPALNLQAIDEAGRPQPSQRVALNADYPALIRANDGTMFVFWLEGGQLMRAVLANGAVLERTSLVNAVYVGIGDRLHSLSAGLDRSHAYVFWNITRAMGENETWFTSGAITAVTSAQPALLALNAFPDASFETGFNTGNVNAAALGEMALSWASPLAGQYDVLPVAVQAPNGLAVVYFQNGAVAGYQEIVPGTHLIGVPALISDRNRDLYLAWSHPSADSAAALLLTTTRH